MAPRQRLLWPTASTLRWWNSIQSFTSSPLNTSSSPATTRPLSRTQLPTPRVSPLTRPKPASTTSSTTSLRGAPSPSRSSPSSFCRTSTPCSSQTAWLPLYVFPSSPAHLHCLTTNPELRRRLRPPPTPYRRQHHQHRLPHLPHLPRAPARRRRFCQGRPRLYQHGHLLHQAAGPRQQGGRD